MNIIFKSCYFLSLVLISSCNSKENQKHKVQESNPIIHSNNLEQLDGNWELIEVNDTSFNMTTFYRFEAKQPTLKIDRAKNVISGFSGCNNYGGLANFTKNKIILLEPVMATQIGCEENVWENDFFKRLLKISNYKVSKDTLKIFLNDRRTLTFKKI